MRTTRSSDRPGGVSTRHPPPLGPSTPLDQTPREQTPPPLDQVPRDQTPPLWTEWQTSVKILPFLKLRLRAVKITSFVQMIYGFNLETETLERQ